MELKPQESPKKLIKRPTVEAQTCLSRSSIYRLMSLGEFPLPIKLSTQAIAWLQSDIDAWLNARIAESQGA